MVCQGDILECKQAYPATCIVEADLTTWFPFQRAVAVLMKGFTGNFVTGFLTLGLPSLVLKVMMGPKREFNSLTSTKYKGWRNFQAMATDPTVRQLREGRPVSSKRSAISWEYDNYGDNLKRCRKSIEINRPCT